MNDIQRHRRGSLAINLGLVANIFLAIAKTVFGIIGHSPALLADGINSTSDVAYGLVVALFMRLSRKPADHEHPFGHSQFEAIAALTVGAFVITTAIGIFWDALNTIFDQMTGNLQIQTASAIAFWVALLTVTLKVILFFYTNAVGQKTRNPAVIAIAYDHRNDIFSASAALVGITLGRMGYAWVDPLAGAIVALVILRTGIFILRQSADELMDAVPSQELETQTREILSGVPGIHALEGIHAHRFGPYIVLFLTILVDGNLTVREVDRLSDLAEHQLRNSIEYLQAVHVHFHPADVNSPQPLA